MACPGITLEHWMDDLPPGAGYMDCRLLFVTPSRRANSAGETHDTVSASCRSLSIAASNVTAFFGPCNSLIVQIAGVPQTPAYLCSLFSRFYACFRSILMSHSSTESSRHVVQSMARASPSRISTDCCDSFVTCLFELAYIGQCRMRAGAVSPRTARNVSSETLCA